MEDEEKRLKMAIIAGAAEAARFKEKNPRATEEQIIQYVTNKTSKILERIDNPL